MDSSGNGLMAFWADIDAEYVLRYQQWHNCEHIPERLSIPGFLKGFRYRSISNEPHFLMFYETNDSATCASNAYMAALNAPTAWTREALPHFRNPVRNVYTRIAAAENKAHSDQQRSMFVAPYISSLRFDLAEGDVDKTRDAEEWLQAASKAENIRRLRLYCVDAAVGNIATSERKIYSGGPGKQAYLLLVEHPAPPDLQAEGHHLDAVTRCGDAALHTSGLTKRLNEECGAYWLEMAYDIQREA